MKTKISGYIMTIVGFLIILTNALDYIFGWDIISPAIGIMGLVFVAIGIKIAKK